MILKHTLKSNAMTEKEQEDKLKELVDEPFVNKLAEVARLIGWGCGDYTEVAGFVQQVNRYLEAPLDLPRYLEPYDVD
jgi:hypothetical protein